LANWFCSREATKRAAGIAGASRDAQIDRIIEGVSRQVERMTRRWFIPRTETRLYRWTSGRGSGTVLWLDADLISVTTLQTKAQDSSPTTISSSDYFLEPNNTGPPYSRIEIDLSSTAAFEAGDTPQRSISVAGSWGYSNDTVAAGTVASGLASDATATSMVCSDGSLIDVGDTLLIESEQVFVSERTAAQIGSQLIDGALTATQSQTSVTVDDGTQFNAGEVILVDAEKMFIDSISGNVLTVRRGWDGTTLAAHSDDTAVYGYRTLTIVRGVNGTTAATHANSTAVTKYAPPYDVQSLCIAEAVAVAAQEGAAWGREVGPGEGAQELSGRALGDLRKRTVLALRRERQAVA